MEKKGELDIITGPMFSGKCLGRDTPVIMFDGTVKSVQNISIGDRLMGADSTPRTVLSVNKGYGRLFEVSPQFTESYIVNEHHILVLSDGIDIVNMPVWEYMQKPQEYKDVYRGIRTQVEYPTVTAHDPYYNGILYSKGKIEKIPSCYRINSKGIRTCFVHGYIDTSECYISEDRTELIVKRFDREIMSILRSIGYRVYTDDHKSMRISSVKNNLAISLQIKNVPDAYLDKLDILETLQGEYFGFEIDGDHLFVLGNYSITHNTTELLRRLFNESEAGLNVLYINHSLDIRSDGPFSTHNPLYKKKLYETSKVSFISSDKLKNINVDKFDVIGIDEAQFFPDLVESVTMWVESKNRHVITGGLSSDSNRELFGKLLYLEPICDTFTKLRSFCKICAGKKVRSVASFTHRLSDSSSQTDVGGNDKYIPVCRKCYLKLEK